MAGTAAFESYALEYDEWFEEHRSVYLAELEAVRAQLPESGKGLEIGVGGGRFAASLGIKTGVEPSTKMGEIAKKRGVEVFQGVAEKLLFPASSFDYALMVTTICFLDDVEAAFNEIYRVLRKEGSFLVGFIDKESSLGRLYQKHKEESPFYREATFYSVADVLAIMEKAGFQDFSFTQTLFHNLDQEEEPEPVQEGHGKGSFVVIKGRKQ